MEIITYKTVVIQWGTEQVRTRPGMSPVMCPSRGLMKSKGSSSPLILIVGLSWTVTTGMGSTCLRQRWGPCHPSSVLGLGYGARKVKNAPKHLGCLEVEKKLSLLQKATLHIFYCTSGGRLDSFVWHFALLRLFPDSVYPLCFLHCHLASFCLPTEMKPFPCTVTDTETNRRLKTEIGYLFKAVVSHGIFVLLC